jgi:hypothetical protein
MTRRQRFEAGSLRPFPDEEQTDRFVGGGYAWDTYPPRKDIPGAVPAAYAQPAKVQERLAEIWMYPQAFIRAAMKHKAQAKTTDRGAEVSFVMDGTEYIGTIEGDGDIARVQAWVGEGTQQPVHFDAVYSDYREYHGIRFPRHIVRSRNGERELELTVCSLKTGSAFEVFVPKAVQTTAQRESVDGNASGG